MKTLIFCIVRSILLIWMSLQLTLVVRTTPGGTLNLTVSDIYNTTCGPYISVWSSSFLLYVGQFSMDCTVITSCSLLTWCELQTSHKYCVQLIHRATTGLLRQQSSHCTSVSLPLRIFTSFVQREQLRLLTVFLSISCISIYHCS